MAEEGLGLRGRYLPIRVSLCLAVGILLARVSVPRETIALSVAVSAPPAGRLLHRQEP